MTCFSRFYFPFRFTEKRRLGQGEEHHLFAGDGANIVVQAQDLDAGESWTIFSINGRAVSTSWDRTCLRRSLPSRPGAT